MVQSGLLLRLHGVLLFTSAVIERQEILGRKQGQRQKNLSFGLCWKKERRDKHPHQHMCPNILPSGPKSSMQKHSRDKKLKLSNYSSPIFFICMTEIHHCLYNKTSNFSIHIWLVDTLLKEKWIPVTDWATRISWVWLPKSYWIWREYLS